MNSNAQKAYQTVSNIDPKYVAEIEAGLGKLRLENSTLVGTIAQLEARLSNAETTVGSQAKQIEALNKEIVDTNQLRAKIR